MSAPLPPTVDTTWRNDPQAAADAAKILKLSSPADLERLTVWATAAGIHIGRYLDRTEPIPGIEFGEPPEDLRFAHANVTVELYRRKDAPFGVLDAWSPDTNAVRIGSDPLTGVKTILAPYRARWGFA